MDTKPISSISWHTRRTTRIQAARCYSCSLCWRFRFRGRKSIEWFGGRLRSWYKLVRGAWARTGRSYYYSMLWSITKACRKRKKAIKTNTSAVCVHTKVIVWNETLWWEESRARGMGIILYLPYRPLHTTRNVCYIITKHRRWRANVYTIEHNGHGHGVCHQRKRVYFTLTGTDARVLPQKLYILMGWETRCRGRDETRYGDGKSSLFIGAKSSISRFTHIYTHHKQYT